MALRETDPEEVGGYPVVDRLGSGGMGVVYLARSASGRRLAVKVVHAQYADDPEFRTRFRREVEAARQVSGAFTAPVVDADADAPSPWMATLYIPGENLGEHVRRHGPLPAERLLELAAGLAEALRDIHRVGVVHRDLKPANVMLAEDGPRVIDFGVSRAAEALAGDPLTQTGRVMGTPPYMSPEQLTSPRDVGPASDVFSLGSVLVHAATGRGPFDDVSPYETATRVVEGDARLDDVPDDLRALVTLCLAKHPKERPTPDELLAVLRGDPVPPRLFAEAQDPPAAAPRRRRRLVIAASAVGALLAGLTTGLVLWLTGGSPPSDLPDGWRAWQHQVVSEDDTPGGSFSGCAAVAGGLICAGDDVKAVRLSLATGKKEWSLPVNTSVSQVSNAEGAVIGASGRRVFVYANNQITSGKDDSDPDNNYAIQAVDARIGKVLWTHPTERGPNAQPPDPDPDVSGHAAYTDDGILTVDGAAGTSYALLRESDGEPRWKRPLPERPDEDATCQVAMAAGDGYLLCYADSKRGDVTRVHRVAPSDGGLSWTVTLDGQQELVGRSADRLVFVSSDLEEKGTGILTVDVDTRSPDPLPLPLEPPASEVTLSRGTLYFTRQGGGVRAVDPLRSRLKWESDSGVEFPGPPLVSEEYVFVASPGGRLAALDPRTGDVRWTRPGSEIAGGVLGVVSGVPPTLVGDALYVPYGIRSVYSVDVRDP
ncbi:protein kinase domain-containing protein [Streptomyces spectabilis]|uniref:Serine/threonine protein kinase n=1 Tax=Streptomyces spectabilis TaxID=68270 RepID=A0A5P2X9Y7_STRST|nr:PQQ-binding-like beta-propeller repeat protein [Streptomyces spectabilis]MBB5109081.1 serine/threonine protein kinase [Streptomyces spectabilis]MCI3902724.1 serine/threonine-protein kinase [Streptomyces spectabilis]QEV60025.1 serine/threonine protein kinase [Streptomyces spectabilis]GGV44593.1 serine/threonine protein kinase [Streptomyces spectabilis]